MLHESNMNIISTGFFCPDNFLKYPIFFKLSKMLFLIRISQVLNKFKEPISLYFPIH